ncbi:MAG TPA: hypothetical protein VJ436_14030, partial [Anaerolineales bacterium]|nr:hypothetical protein [Anaerolineales bacterium]
RKGWSIADRRLLGVLESRQLATPQDFLELLPPSLPQPFTTLELAQELGRPAYLARKMVYCLRAMGVVESAGKRGRAGLFQARDNAGVNLNIRSEG